MTNKIKFTKRKIESLPVADKTITYHDTETTGLKLTISKAGTYTFMVYRKIKGRPERVKLGNFPAMTVEQAKKAADIVNAQIAQGNNPNDGRRADRAELNLNDLFVEYLENHAKQYKKSWATDEMNYRNHLAHWDNRKLSHITRKDVQGLHRKIGNNTGKPQANRILALLKVMFSKAIEWGMFEGLNPAHGIKQYKEKSRERFLQADELQAFFKSVADEENETIRDYVLISLLTGARRSNVLAMQWDEIDFDRKEWRIPETKSGDSHTLPLMAEVLQILDDRKDNDSSFVFSGSGKTGHLVEPKKGWARILKRAKITNLRIHDLRRSLGSWQATTGASLPIIGKTLAHKNVSTTAIYARLNNDPVRESMEKATSAMLNAGKDKAEVVPIIKKKA